MDSRVRWAAALVAATSHNAYAQTQADPNSTPAHPISQSTSSPNGDEPPPSHSVAKTIDGVVLPDEVQLELEAEIKKKADEVKAEAERRPGGEVEAAVEKREILVKAELPRGSIMSDVRPESTLSTADILSTGAVTVADLINVLAQRLDGGRSRSDGGPVVLLNGKRVTNFAEIANIPTEAIERTEIFSEEVALQYGYDAEKKVLNIVTFENFAATVDSLYAALATEGGYASLNNNFQYVRITGDTRFIFDANFRSSGNLLESERDVEQLGGVTGQGQFRSLLASSKRYSLNGAVSRPLPGAKILTLSASFSSELNDALVGRSAAGVLRRHYVGRIGRVAASLGGSSGKWIWTANAAFDLGENSTLTDSSSSVRDQSRSSRRNFSADLKMYGPVMQLPAGPLTLSLRGGVEVSELTSRSSSGGVVLFGATSRDRGSVQASIVLPILDRKPVGLAWPGQLSLNLNVEFARLSDLGGLRTFGYGLSWSPTDALAIVASTSVQRGAPTLEELRAPLLATPNFSTYDFARGEAVDVVRLTGGNANLSKDNRRIVSVSAIVAPFSGADFKLRAAFVDVRLDNPIFGISASTDLMQAAFPDRYQRDAAGRLVSIDSRAINFKSADQQQLRIGIDFSRPLDKTPAWLRGAKFFSRPVGSDLPESTGPDRIVINAEPGSALAKGVEGLASRLTFNLSYVLRLKDVVAVREGFPELDLLDGVGVEQRGGRSRHEIELQAGVFKRGVGARVVAKWESSIIARRIASLSNGGVEDLKFKRPLIFNISLFLNFDEFKELKLPSLFSGSRVTIDVSNLLNIRQAVENEDGIVPLNYQSAFFDPLGRVVSISFRKRF